MITLQTSHLRLSLHHPEDGFYRGTRFDRSGIFDSLSCGGENLTDRWFERYDPFLHDAVCGPAEEWNAVGFEETAPGGTFCKPGVGLLVRPDGAPYDRFRLYEVADPGEWTVESTSRSVTFRHRLKGWYDYRKKIVIGPGASFRICHALRAFRPFVGEVYNHNFFTLGLLKTGPSREIRFPFRPEGDWRAEYDAVAFTGNGIRFSRELSPDESVYCGNVRAAGTEGMPYAFVLGESETGNRVHVLSDSLADRSVFWANHRIACLEPYIRFCVSPGKPFSLRIGYEIE